VRSGVWDYRMGETQFRAFRNAIPGVGETPFALELYQAVNPGTTARVFASPTYLAEVYLDFGLAGALLTYCFLGVLLAWLQVRLLKTPKTPLRLVLLAFVFLMLGRTVITGMSAVFSSGIVLFILYSGFRGVYALVSRSRWRAIGMPQQARQLAAPHPASARTR
jgi:oligosaccharide repeat unit polymerase